MELKEPTLREKISGFINGNNDPKLEAELPYASMMVTLMAASGISPYESFKRMREVDTLERFQSEGEEIVRLVEVLGNDPLTAMEKRASETVSKPYADFLEGYISSVKSGGSVVNYLNSKLKSIFDEHAAKATNNIERLETLVEAYMVMLIVIFCFYILSSVTSPTSGMMGATGLPDTSAYIYPLILVVIPVFSLFFMYVANNTRRGTLVGIRKPYLVAIGPGLVFAALFTATQLVPSLNVIYEVVSMPMFVTIGLVGVSIIPAVLYHRIAKKNFAAENALPSLIRDVTEARRTGLSPEKSIVHAVTRRGYGAFTPDLRRMMNQIEWGVPLRTIYKDLAHWVKSWPVIVNFYILVETVEIGGGDANTLGILAEFSEKVRTIERNQRNMLMPYIILPFIWTILMVFTVTFTINTLSSIPALALGSFTNAVLSEGIISNSSIIEAGIIFHSWLSGFFIGKVSEGNFASGFKFSALLSLTAYTTLIVSQQLVAGFMGGIA